MKLSRLVLVSGLFVFSSLLSAQSDQPFSSLEERMTGSEFTESGLHKLSPEELETLNRWIRERSVAKYEGPPEGSTLPSAPGEVPAIERMARERFQSRIKGEFNGWTGETVFELENGMVWRQSENTTFFIPPVENPVVTIRPGIMSSWILSVEGYSSSTRVERIK